ncbi:unnamed protein product [Rangifer tarandus platyrhynchus]|uniref:Uncharacterized protein n=1 Tax=Rangifer tarandus platyrhynchus TaxID=3082113 RepID=A0AC59ZUA6_RANTA
MHKDSCLLHCSGSSIRVQGCAKAHMVAESSKGWARPLINVVALSSKFTSCLLCEWTGAFRFPPPAATEALSGEGGGDTAQEERAWFPGSCGLPGRHHAQLSQQQALATLKEPPVPGSCGTWQPVAASSFTGHGPPPQAVW